MSRYEFGSASNDGSGSSSINLLTGNYIAKYCEKASCQSMQILNIRITSRYYLSKKSGIKSESNFEIMAKKK